MKRVKAIFLLVILLTCALFLPGFMSANDEISAGNANLVVTTDTNEVSIEQNSGTWRAYIVRENGEILDEFDLKFEYRISTDISGTGLMSISFDTPDNFPYSLLDGFEFNLLSGLVVLPYPVAPGYAWNKWRNKLISCHIGIDTDSRCLIVDFDDNRAAYIVASEKDMSADELLTHFSEFIERIRFV